MRNFMVVSNIKFSQIVLEAYKHFPKEWVKIPGNIFNPCRIELTQSRYLVVKKEEFYVMVFDLKDGGHTSLDNYYNLFYEGNVVATIKRNIFIYNISLNQEFLWLKFAKHDNIQIKSDRVILNGKHIYFDSFLPMVNMGKLQKEKDLIQNSVDCLSVMSEDPKNLVKVIFNSFLLPDIEKIIFLNTVILD